ncbi:MAG: hypothetical protein Kow0042_10400 [Calditrichia bacterium]
MPVLAYSPHMIISPLIRPMEEGLVPTSVRLEKIPQSEIINRLENKTVDLGIISPLDYSQSKSKLLILPEPVFYITDRGMDMLLFFQENLRSINRIFYQADPDLEFENFMGKIILNEFLGVDAEWIALKEFDSAENILKKYPVFFQVGKKAFFNQLQVENFIDLTEEWKQNTNLPLVYRFLAARNDFQERECLQQLHAALRYGLQNFEQIAAKEFEDSPELKYLYLKMMQENYRFTSADLVWDALKEILQYLFYYGETNYIPDLYFLP